MPHRWLITPERISPHETALCPHPGGRLNLGVAHGIPGVVAALAAAREAGHRVPGDDAALRRMTSWMVTARTADDVGPLWPADIGVDADGREITPSRAVDQLAWCYGSAGASIALLGAAEALSDSGLREVAVESFEAVLVRTERYASLSPTLCHGRSGLLVLCLEFAAATGSERVMQHAERLLDEVLAFADPARPLLFADVEEHDVVVDCPSLLTGAAGVALALFAAAAPVRPSWLRAFLAR